jgi:hypothetical protein
MELPRADSTSPETRLLRAIYGQCPDCDQTETHEHPTDQERATRSAPLSVRCPICLSLIGERCRSTITGQPYNLVHHARVLLWEKTK